MLAGAEHRGAGRAVDHLDGRQPHLADGCGLREQRVRRDHRIQQRQGHGDAKTAHVQLQWVAEQGKDDVMRDFARLRLAALLLDEKAYDDALKQLATAPQAALEARFAELKGDVLVAQGNKTDAAKSYAAALDAVDKAQKPESGKEGKDANSPHEPYRNMVQSKLDSLGGVK